MTNRVPPPPPAPPAPPRSFNTPISLSEFKPSDIGVEGDDEDEYEVEQPIHTYPVDLQVKIMQRKKYEQDVIRLKRENDIATGQTLPVDAVREAVAEALKGITQTLNSLPDKLERAGIVTEPTDIDMVVKLIDGMRNGIALQFSKIGE